MVLIPAQLPLLFFSFGDASAAHVQNNNNSVIPNKRGVSRIWTSADITQICKTALGKTSKYILFFPPKITNLVPK